MSPEANRHPGRAPVHDISGEPKCTYEDGIISSDEAASAWIETFHQLDQNGKDQLSQDELDRMQAQQALVDQRFGRLDGNGDGQISVDKYASAGHDLIQLADLNGDGEVSAWEYRAARVTDR